MPRTAKHTPPDLAEVTLPVEDLAEWLVLTPTRVQQLAKKGIVVKTEHGVYQLKASVQGYIREMNAKADGKNSKYHQERTKLMEIKRRDAERTFLEAMKQLVNADRVVKAIERAKADDKQQILFMPKALATRFEGDPAANEAILEEWAHQYLKTRAEIDIFKSDDPEAQPGPETRKADDKHPA